MFFKKLLLLLLLNLGYSCGSNNQPKGNKKDQNKEISTFDLINSFRNIQEFKESFETLKDKGDLFMASILVSDKLEESKLKLAQANEILKLFQLKGFNINEKRLIEVSSSFIENTLLHKFVLEKEIKSLNLFLDLGADINIKNGLGQTPYELAKSLAQTNRSQEYDGILAIFVSKNIDTDTKKNEDEDKSDKGALFSPEDILSFGTDSIREDIDNNDLNYTTFKAYFTPKVNNISGNNLNSTFINMILRTAIHVKETNKSEQYIINFINLILENLKEVDLNEKINEFSLLQTFLLNSCFETCDYLIQTLGMIFEVESQNSLVQNILRNNVTKDKNEMKNKLKRVNYLFERFTARFEEQTLRELLRFYCISDDLKKVGEILNLENGLEKEEISTLSVLLQLDDLADKDGPVDPLILKVLELFVLESTDKREDVSELIKYFLDKEEFNESFKTRFKTSLRILANMDKNALETDNFSGIISLIQAFNLFPDIDIDKFKDLSEILFKSTVNINEEVNGTTALYEGIASGRSEIVEILINKRANVNETINGHNYLYYAIKSKNKEIMEILLKKVDVLKYPEAIEYAVSEAFKEIIPILKTKGFDINREVNGDTALHIAIRNNNIEIMEILVRNGAKFNIKGSTPLAPTALGTAMKIKTTNMINKIKELYDELNFEVHPDDKAQFEFLMKK